jgi:hypothetical protein
VRYNIRFPRERNARRESFKADALALEPSAVCKPVYDGPTRRFVVSVGDRTLGKGISASVAWKRALENLKGEQ